MSITKAELTAENRPAWNENVMKVTTERRAGTHEDQGGVQILVVLLDIIRVILRCLSFVHHVKVEAWVIVASERLHERP